MPLEILFELVALLVGVFCFSKLPKPLQLFVLFLGLVVAVEILGWYIRHHLHTNNAWLYNISIPIEYMMYSYLFACFFQNHFLKKIAQALLILIPLFAVVNMLLLQGLFIFNTNILWVGNIIMVVLSCCYFADVLQMQQDISLLKTPMFWIATGVLLFNLGELTYNLFFDYLLKNEKDKKLGLFKLINHSLIYVLYSLISIAFLCATRSLKKPYPKN